MRRFESCSVNPVSPWSLIALGWMAVSLAARFVYYLPEGLTGFDWWVYVGIPGAASAWFFVALPLWGKRTLLPTCASVLGGVFYFIVKAFTFAHWWHTALCCLLYLAVLVLYALVVLGWLPKQLLYPLFGLPLAFHLFVEDVINYVIPRAPFHTWLPEISVLTIMASLLTLSIAMKQKIRK